MQTPSIPPYKPPPEVQEALKQQATQRKRSAHLPKRNWVQRNPRLFQVSFLTSSLLVLFSKPLYDIFFAETFPELGEAVRFERRK